MATDLAIDYNTGDLIVSPTKDLSVRTGLGVVEQRIRVRLRAYYGMWDIDPSLGSRLHDMLRMPDARARQTAELAVREALEPMTDITVHGVSVTTDPKDSRKINLSITYAMLEDGEDPSDALTTTTTLGAGE